MMARAKAKAASSKAYLQGLWDSHGALVLIICGLILAVLFVLWLFGVISFGPNNSVATQLAPGTDEKTIAQTIHDQSVKEFAPVNKRLDSLEAGQKALSADLGSVKADVERLKGGQSAIQSRKLDGNLMMKFLDELDKNEPPTKPVSQLEGGSENFLPSPA